MNNFYRKKLLNSILYFAKNTRHANTTKIFKLLNFFDFEHFCLTGYPSIGLEYFSFPKGPVPKELWYEFKGGNVPEDFQKDLGINIESKDEADPNFIEYQFKAKHNPDLNVFSPRELQILENLVLIYKYCTASEISKISHEKEKPWLITKENYGLYQPINYLLALKDNSCITKEQASEVLSEHFEMFENFKIKPT
jgi:uncharacterized phage-associated protein